jgi:3-hydroxybutyryl-CoA dehydrogenase
MRKFLTELDQTLPADIPILCQCSDVTLTEAATWVEVPDRLVGMDGLFFASGRAATLVASPTLSPKIRAIVNEWISGTGRLPVWIADSPGLILPRILAMLANEAAFAVQEGVAQANQIDIAMKLGASYPTGPLSWANNYGYAHVLDLLDHLHAEFGEERHRPANLLRRWARLQQVST